MVFEHKIAMLAPDMDKGFLEFGLLEHKGAISLARHGLRTASRQEKINNPGISLSILKNRHQCETRTTTVV